MSASSASGSAAGAERESGDDDLRDPDRSTPESIDQTTRDRWSELRNTAVAADPFAEVEFVVGLAHALDWRVQPVFVESDGLEAGAMFIKRRRGLLSQVVVPPFSPYSAILLPRSTEAGTTKLLSLILEAANDLSPDTTIILSPENSSQCVLRPPEPWSTDTYQTYRCATGRIEDVIGGWSSSTRRTFRRSGDEFEPVTDFEIVPDILGFVEAAYARHDRSLPIPRARLYDLALSLIASDHAQVIGVRRRETGKVEAGVVMLSNSDRAWYWIAGSRPGAAMTVCIGHVLAECHRQGIRSFDFMGANTPSIAEFKRRFGGELIDYTVFETPRRPLVRLAKRVRELLPGGGAS